MLFDIAPSEFLLIAGAAIIFIGPKDMPRALRTAGQWLGKARRMSNHVRTGFETMIREAELAEMEEQWRAQNAAIMAAHPAEATPISAEAMAAPVMLPLPAPPAIKAAVTAAVDAPAEAIDTAPELPLPGARRKSPARKPRAPKAGDGL